MRNLEVRKFCPGIEIRTKAALRQQLILTSHQITEHTAADNLACSSAALHTKCCVLQIDTLAAPACVWRRYGQWLFDKTYGTAPEVLMSLVKLCFNALTYR